MDTFIEILGAVVLIAGYLGPIVVLVFNALFKNEQEADDVKNAAIKLRRNAAQCRAEGRSLIDPAKMKRGQLRYPEVILDHSLKKCVRTVGRVQEAKGCPMN